MDKYTIQYADAYNSDCKIVFNNLETSHREGLSASEAERRLLNYGDNALKGDSGISWYRVLMGQLGDYRLFRMYEVHVHFPDMIQPML